jgi:hypothetical protein
MVLKDQLITMEGAMLATLNPQQYLVLFWIFVVFFVLIGVIALLTILGVIRADKQFRKWALGGFVVGVVGVVFVWAKSELPLDYMVNLPPPKGVEIEAFRLVSGRYHYDDYNPKSDRSAPLSGPVELTAGHAIGWWTAKFPSSGTNKPVRLTLKDQDENWWEVLSFYPYVNNKDLTRSAALQGDTATSVVTPVLVSSAFAAGGQIKFNNYAKPVNTQDRRTYFKWRVFVDEPDQVLNRIAEVQYLLHPTFPEPLQIRTNPNDKFAVDASGWGEFLIQITIKYKDQTTVKTGYQLNLGNRWP